MNGRFTHEQIQAARKEAIRQAMRFMARPCLGGQMGHTIYSADTGEVRLEGSRRLADGAHQRFTVYVEVGALANRVEPVMEATL